MTVADIHQGAQSLAARSFVPLWLAVALVAVALLAIGTGPTGLSPARIVAAMVGLVDLSLQERVVLWDIRLPRLGMGLLIGGALAVSGALMQALFRNPLADPGLIGVGPGAALGAVSAIVLGGAIAPFLPFALPYHLVTMAAAFLGGWGATLLLVRLTMRSGVTEIGLLLLAGIALAAIAGAATGVLVTLADDTQLRDLSYWQMGSLSGATWGKLGLAAVVFSPVLALAPRFAAGLNALALGEAAAHHMGHDVEQIKRRVILLTAVGTGGAVALSGGIGFVGVVVPHVLRLALGPDHRMVLPCAAVLGGALLVLADVIARQLVAPAEMPIGILTALIGAPVFLHLLMARMGRAGL